MGRLADFREFAVPFRVLPYAQPEPYKGSIKDTALQAVIRQYGDCCALVNAGDKPTKVTLTLPGQVTRVFDLSSGVASELKTSRDNEGRLCADIPMEYWSLKTLRME